MHEYYNQRPYELQNLLQKERKYYYPFTNN